LKYFKINEELCSYQSKIDTIKKILLILPVECKDKSEFKEFIADLNKIFSKSKISTFQMKNLRLHEQNWFGVPNDRYFSELQSQTFGLIIDLNIKPDKVCAYICARSGIPIRINLISGKYDHVYNLYFRSEKDETINDRYNLMLDSLKKLK
jgi:hypothetical protein